MEETIKNKVQHSTTLMFRETLSVMVEFGIITEKQKQLLEWAKNNNMIGNDKEFLDKVGNPERYSNKR